MSQVLLIEKSLPSLKEIQGHYDKSKKSGDDFINQWQDEVAIFIKKARLKFVRQASFEFIWIERYEDRNKNDISSGGRTIILNSLVKNNVLKNNDWQSVVCWSDHFCTTRQRTEFREGGVRIIIRDVYEEFKHLMETKEGVNGGWTLEEVERINSGNFD